jgi:DNA-binding NarL/FixJ family response regulator
MTATRILMVDDHTVIADAMRDVLRSEFQQRDRLLEVQVCGSLKESAPFLLSYKYDLVFLDLKLPDVPDSAPSRTIGVMLIKALDAAGATPVLVVSGSDDPATIEQCRLAGARGFLSKAANGGSLIHAVDTALAPGEFFSISGSMPMPPVVPPVVPPVMQRPVAIPTRIASTGDDIKALGITPRQLEVLALLVEGHTNKQIASRFSLSEGTVKIHVSSVLEKLGVHRRREVKQAVESLNIVLPVNVSLPSKAELHTNRAAGRPTSVS